MQSIKITVGYNKEKSISLGNVIRILHSHGLNFKSSMILYYSNKEKSFCLCGSAKDADTCFLPLSELNGELILKYRNMINNNPNKLNDPTNILEDNNKKLKERKIREVIEKVIEWRRLYSTKVKDDGSKLKYNLEEAADIVGISKKTLDDYLLQIRAGYKYNFDFNMYSEAKIGLLRSYVKLSKSKRKSSILT